MILIDTREPKEIENWFKAQNITIETQREMLDIGDYIIKINDVEVAVERKTPADFVSSLFSGHLNNQLYKLSTSFPISFIVVTWNFSEQLVDGTINSKTLISSLLSASLKQSQSGINGQIHLIQLEDDYFIPEFLGLLHNRVEKGDFTRHLKLKSGVKGEDWLLAMYKGLPKIGEGKAKKLIKSFPSLYSLVSASKEEISKVEGIGKNIASEIFNIIREG